MTFEDFENSLREKSLRLTQARKEIFNLLQDSEKSLSPREIFENIQAKSGTDLASVYRNLTLFHEMGFAHRFQDGSFSSCLHEHENDQHHKHIHFINHCVKCGRKDEIKTHSKKICALAEEIAKISHTLSSLNEIVVQGFCKKCATQ